MTHRLPDDGAAPDIPLESLPLRANKIASSYNATHVYPSTLNFLSELVHAYTNSLACMSPDYLGRGNRAWQLLHVHALKYYPYVMLKSCPFI